MLKHMLTLIWNKRKKNALLFVEIFFCFLIVFGIATFAINNFRSYLSPYGYETGNLWHISLYKPLGEIDSSVMVDTHHRIKQEVESINQVEAAAFGGMAVPFSGSMWRFGSDDMGFDFNTSGLRGDADYNKVFGLTLSEGRWFVPEDTIGGTRPIVINRQTREEYFGSEPILDSILTVNGEWKVVGVVDHFRYRDGFEEEQSLTVFYAEEYDLQMADLYLRVAPGSGGAVEEQIINRLSDLLKTEDIVINDLNENRIQMALGTWILIVVFLTIGGFLIINIALGLFGVLFYSISKRRPEIGVRRAMGATGAQISRQITGEVYLVAALAMLVAAAFAIQIPLLGLMEGAVQAIDAYWAIFAAFVLISLVVLACAYIPSRAAAGLHPAEVLHEN